MPSIFDTLPGEVSPQTPPTPQGQPDDGMQDLLRQAGEMANLGGPGANDKAAQQWLNQRLVEQGYEIQEEPQSIFSNLPQIGSRKPPAAAPQQATAKAESSEASVALARTKAFFRDWGKNHETTQGEALTPAEVRAAKLLGVPLRDMVDFGGKDNQTGYSYGPVYKLTPEELQQSELDAMPEGERKALVASKERGKKFLSGDLTLSNWVSGFAHESLAANLGQGILYPNLARTMRRESIKKATALLEILDHPENYDEGTVAEAKEVSRIMFSGHGFTETMKALGKAVAEDPRGAAAKFVAGIGVDPELLFVPLGAPAKAATAAKTARILARAGEETQRAGLAAAVNRAAQGPGGEFVQMVAGTSERTVAQAERNAARLAALGQRVETAGRRANLAGGALAEGTLNAGIDAAQQQSSEGFVADGSLSAPFAMGATIGGGLRGLGRRKPSIFDGLEKEMPQKAPGPEPVPPSEHEPIVQVSPEGDQAATAAGKVMRQMLEGVSEKLSIDDIEAMATRVGGLTKIPTVIRNKLYSGVKLGEAELAQMQTLAERHTRELLSGGGATSQAALAAEARKTPMGHGKVMLLVGGTAGTAMGTAAALSGDDQHRVANFIVGALAGSALGVVGTGATGARGRFRRQGGMFSLARDPKLRERASFLEDHGETPEGVWQKTGLVKSADGKWLREISDDKMVPHWNRLTEKPQPFLKVIDHPELRRAMPGFLESLKVAKSPPRNDMVFGWYDAANKTVYLRDPKDLYGFVNKHGPDARPRAVLGHETQHAIQDVEGLPYGSSPDLEERGIMEAKKRLAQGISALGKEIAAEPNPWIRRELQAQKAAMLQDYRQHYNPQAIRRRSFERYFNTAGEVQSRDTQARIDMTPEERAAKLPGDPAIPPRRQRLTYSGRALDQVEPENPASLPSFIPHWQRGSITFDQAKRLALIGLGVTAGYKIADDEHKIAGVLKGAAAGIALGSLSFAGVQSMRQALRAADTAPRISKFLDKMEGDVAVDKRHLYALTAGIKIAVPDLARREAIAHWLEGDTSVQLSPVEKQAAAQVRAAFDRLYIQANELGIVKQGLGNYVTHIYSKDKLTQALLNAYRQSATKTSSKFGLQRKGPPTLRVAIAAGLKVETDVAEILQRYGNDMLTAIHGNLAVRAMKKVVDANGVPVIVSAKRAPLGYVTNNHPTLNGLKVHPAIAAELTHVFDVYSPTVLGAAYDALNGAVKRIKLSLSLFHAKNLGDVAMGVKANPLANLRDIVKAAVGKTAYHDMIRSPKVGDEVDHMIRAGAVGEFTPKGNTNIDMGTPMEATLSALGDTLDKVFPGAGRAVVPLKILDRFTQKVTWENIWTGLKATAIATKFHSVKANWAKAVSRDPSLKMPSDAEIWAMTASFGNNVFGGLNWRRIANEVKNKYLRQLIMGSLAPPGQRRLGILMLAPDFTAATFRHILGSFGDGTNFGGLLKARTMADLHRQWFIKSTLYYLVIGNAMNYAMSGHFMWDNRDPFMIDLGDGRKMQWAKVLTDPFRIVAHPQQEALNKMNPILQEGLSQALGVEYLSASGHAPRLNTTAQKAAHAAKLFDPIQTTQIGQYGWGGAITGALGTPIYGETDAKRAKRKEAGRKRQRETARKKRGQHSSAHRKLRGR